MDVESQQAPAKPPLPESEGKRIWLVADNLQIDFELPVPVIPNHTLRRPSSEELAKIRELHLQSRTPEIHRVYYECGWAPIGNGTGQTALDLPPDQWRYYVIEPPQTGEPMGDGGRLIDAQQDGIERAARLCDVELSFAATLYPSGGWHYDHSGPVVRRFFGPEFTPKPFKENHLTEIRLTYERLHTVGPRFPEIERAANMYFALKRVDHDELYVLGVFAIIESLLTHDATGGYDSLTHQICSKFPLLNRRMSTPVDYSAFGAPRESQIWKKLYGYRSAIAHGAKPDFTKDLQLLKSMAAVRKFLDHALKALLRYGLQEPELVTDLRGV